MAAKLSNVSLWWWTGRHADSNDDESLVKITPAQMQPGRLERPTHGNSDKKKKTEPTTIYKIN